MAQINLPTRNPNVYRFHQHLRLMEGLYPRTYPKGTAQRYLQVVANSPSYQHSPGLIDDHLLACLTEKQWLSDLRGQMERRSTSNSC